MDDTRGTLSSKIIKRFLSEEEYNKFLENYDGHKKALRSGNRFVTFKQPLTQKELSVLNDALFDETATYERLADKYDLPKYPRSAIGVLALRYLYQQGKRLA